MPELRSAIAGGELSPAKASRLVSTIKSENAHELIAFAKEHNSREIDFEVRKRNPLTRKPDRYRVLSQDQVEVTITLSRSEFSQLQRNQSLLAQKNRPAKISDAVVAGLESFAERHDPVRRAERNAKSRSAEAASNAEAARNADAKMNAKSRSAKAAHKSRDFGNVKGPLKEMNSNIEKASCMPGGAHSFCANRTTARRVPLTADEKHAVVLRDQGRCTYKNEEGIRCNSDRWVDIHHIILRSEGGSNHPDNLTTLCSFHHDLIHQMAFPINEEWIRSRAASEKDRPNQS